MTSRGLREADFVRIGEFLERAVAIALDVQEKHGKPLKDFEKVSFTMSILYHLVYMLYWQS